MMRQSHAFVSQLIDRRCTMSWLATILQRCPLVLIEHAKITIPQIIDQHKNDIWASDLRLGRLLGDHTSRTNDQANDRNWKFKTAAETRKRNTHETVDGSLSLKCRVGSPQKKGKRRMNTRRTPYPTLPVDQPQRSRAPPPAHQCLTNAHQSPAGSKESSTQL